jgi:hypothetical protein
MYSKAHVPRCHSCLEIFKNGKVKMCEKCHSTIKCLKPNISKTIKDMTMPFGHHLDTYMKIIYSKAHVPRCHSCLVIAKNGKVKNVRGMLFNHKMFEA